MFLMVENGIAGGICLSIYQYTKANKKNMKDYPKNKESLYNVAKVSSKEFCLD